ncbi:MAG: hypothetical protein HFI35_16770 [Roseburia sp.]|jgi:hypothetical protein|nr:hypothetical protein [Roseburia sp.]
MDQDWIEERLRLLTAKAEKIVIVPMGKWGRTCKEILEGMGRTDLVFLDNRDYDDRTVFPVEGGDHWYTDALYLIAAANEGVRKEIREQLERHVAPSQLADLFSDDLIQSRISQYGKVTLDFLCCGFAKCGTTSLHVALRQNPNVFLPDVKETMFADNIWLPSAHRNLRLSYPPKLTAGKITGGIEPAYLRSAKTVHDYFGEHLRLLFCVRNPVKAAYSLFRMQMRDGFHDRIFYYLQKYKNISPEVFDEWVRLETEKDTFCYMDYIREYLNYYPKDQVRIVVFEDMIKRPDAVMQEIQEYIGLDRQHRSRYDALPHINEGDRIPKNLACAYINRSIMGLMRETEESDVELFASMQSVRDQIWLITNEEYSEPMREETKEELTRFYMDSIRELEDFLERSLKGTWYEE